MKRQPAPGDPRAPAEELREQLAEHLERLRQEGVWGLKVETVGKEGDSPPAASPTPATQPRAPQPMVPRPVTARVDTFHQVDLFGGGRPGLLRADADETLPDVEAEALACVACGLHRGRTNVVFGVGIPMPA